MRHSIFLKLMIVALALSSLQCGKKESASAKVVTATVHPNSSLFVYRSKRFVYEADVSGIITAREIAPNSFDFGLQIQNGDGSADSKDLVIAGVTMEVIGYKEGKPLTAMTSTPDFAKACAAGASSGISQEFLRKYYAIIPKNTTFIGYSVTSTSCLNLIPATTNNPETFLISGLPINDETGNYRVKVELSGWFIDAYDSTTQTLGKPVENFTKTFYFQTVR